MATSLTHKYIPRVEQLEENLFTEEYYSSTDVKIYIDDIEQSEIAYISYSLQEQLKPIYGYASNTFDDVAIGNRIVTGMLKVPIKNPEAQTKLDTVIERAKNTTLEDYNDNQQELLNAVDWITEGTIGSSEAVQEDDETFEYRTKLINLGYDLDYNSSPFVLVQQIKKFQQDNKLDITGNLNSVTKNKINELLKKGALPTISLPKGTMIYVSPIFASSGKPTTENKEVYILDDTFDDGWVHIMTEDGTEGYINTKEVG